MICVDLCVSVFTEIPDTCMCSPLKRAPNNIILYKKSDTTYLGVGGGWRQYTFLWLRTYDTTPKLKTGFTKWLFKACSKLKPSSIRTFMASRLKSIDKNYKMPTVASLGFSKYSLLANPCKINPVEVGRMESISKYLGTTQYQYRTFKVSKYRHRIGWFIFNVIPGHRGPIHPPNFL